MGRVRNTILGQVFATAVLVALLSLFPLVSFAQMTHTFVGLSPSSDQLDSVLREVPITKTLNLQRDLDELDLTLEVTFRGEGAEYLKGEPTAYFPVGMKAIEYEVTIDAAEAPMGTYEAVVEFLPSETSFAGEGTGLGVKRGVGYKLAFSISDEEVVSYMLIGENFSLTEVGSPIVFSYSVTNDGNVNWRPDEIVISTYEYVTQELFEEFRISDFDSNPPGSTTTQVIEIDHTLPPGTYDVVIDYYEDDIMIESSNASLTVFAEGTLDQRGEITSLTTNKSQYAAGEIIKVEVDFQNSGELRVVGRLVTEIYDASGSLIDILTSDDLAADIGENITFSDTVQIGSAGSYTISAYVEYGNKVTDVLEIPVSVESLTLAAATRRPLMLIAGIIFVVAIVVFVALALSKRKKKGGAPAPAAPTGVPVPPAAPAQNAPSPPAKPTTVPMPQAPAAPVTPPSAPDPAPTPPAVQPAPAAPTPQPVVPAPTQVAPQAPTAPPTPAPPPRPTPKPVPPPATSTPQPVSQPPSQATTGVAAPEQPSGSETGTSGSDDNWSISL